MLLPRGTTDGNPTALCWIAQLHFLFILEFFACLYPVAAIESIILKLKSQWVWYDIPPTKQMDSWYHQHRAEGTIRDLDFDNSKQAQLASVIHAHDLAVAQQSNEA